MLFQSHRSESDPISLDLNMASINGDLKIHINNDSDEDHKTCLDKNQSNDLKNFKVPTISVEQINNPRIVLPRCSTMPSSPVTKRSYKFISSGLNNLQIPSPNVYVNSSPRVLRRSQSMRVTNQKSGSASPKIRRTLGSPDFNLDSISNFNFNMENADHVKSPPSLSILMSGIYALFLVMLGVIIYISDQHKEHRLYSEIFSSILIAIGVMWLLLFHVGLWKYKTQVLKQLKQAEDEMQDATDKMSCATEFIINSGFSFSAVQNRNDGDESKPPPFRFLMGRHSGSFYLKIGSAGFCFGYLIYQGLQLGQHILHFVTGDDATNCSMPSSVVLHILSPLYAFYQLFITFKYSNIVINRNIILARFGLMHLIATCVCHWFSTIVEEAGEDYYHRNGNFSSNDTTPVSTFDIANFHITVERKASWNDPLHCSVKSVLSTRSLSAIPYLYPFAIEYNLLLAAVWFIVWQNIGKEHTHSNPHHLRHTISQDAVGSDQIAYQSNLVINADCHSANKGLFIGLFLLLTTIVTVIVFFVCMTTKGYEEQAVAIHTGQEGILTLICLLAVCFSFYQVRKLDINEHPITFLDDVLLFIPLPFYFIHGIMSIMAEFAMKNYSRLALHILVTIEVIVQTPFIIDGLRRCSNTHSLRYKKPGREVITFLIILNLTLWIVNTFELKSVEHFHGQEEYFGDLIWMFIGHTTLPLMLFYRFHSSVCLADMWKSAYEKEAPHHI
ncbi:hypothetical protein JTE90_011018 [Oedothorax gibbosus]|uniref:Otopetrin-2 n=1 Tax=Oedothorax gibbosus TaxID=931172 RepID=A0AAV6VDZ4_9ARAC|nr:hypothetical protein JTE90_011018 [Oedothorax gibbosus]